MKHFGYFLAAGVLVVFAVFGGASEARACTSITNARINPGNSSVPAPIPATLQFDVSGCMEGDQLRLTFDIGGVIVATQNSPAAPAGVTGTTSVQYNFSAGDDSACVNGQCRLEVEISVPGSSLVENASMRYGCGAIGCSGTPSSFGVFNPSWSTLPPDEDNPNDGGGATSQQTSFARLQNPIAYDNIPDVIRQLITIVFIIGVPLVALAIIYAGFLLVTAGGDQNKLTKGKQALLAGVLGGAILLGAWVIAEAIQGTVDQIRGV
jgi:hypothetical protein